MESATIALASSVISILTPYAQQTAEALVEAVGEAGYTKAKDLFESLKSRWAGKPAGGNLEEFQKDPTGNKNIMSAVIQKQLDTDPELRADVDRRVQDIGPMLTVFQDMEVGRDITGAKVDEFGSGTIGIHQKIKDAQNVTGAEIKRMG